MQQEPELLDENYSDPIDLEKEPDYSDNGCEGKSSEQEVLDFNEKLVTSFSVPIPFFKINDQNVKVPIGIYRGDLIKLSFWSVDLAMDYWLKENLKYYYAEYLLENITKDTDSFIKELQEFSIALSTLKGKDLDKKKDILKKYILKNHSLKYKKLFLDFFRKKIFYYLLYQEISKCFKEKYLGPRDIKSIFSFALGRIKTNTFWKFINKQPIPITSILKWGVGFYSRPLTTGMSYGTYLIDEFFKFAGWKPEFLDKYYTFIFKEYLMMVCSIKNLDRIFMDKWINYLVTNNKEILDYLTEYKKITSNNITSAKKEELFKVENSIKDFIVRGHTYSFKNWLKFKNIAFMNAEMNVNILFNLPTIFIAIKNLYKKHKAGELKFFENLLHSEAGLWVMGVGFIVLYYGAIISWSTNADY